MSANKPHQEADQEEVKLDEQNKRWVFKPRGFSIIWGNDSRYWTIPSKGTDQPAELVQVCWLELTASTTTNLAPGKKYEISFKISMKQGAFGWSGCPVFMMAKIGKKGRYRWTKINLSDQGSDKTEIIPQTSKFQIEVPTNAANPNPNDPDTKLYFGLYEVWTGKWKGGLQIYEAVVQEVVQG